MLNVDNSSVDEDFEVSEKYKVKSNQIMSIESPINPTSDSCTSSSSTFHFSKLSKKTKKCGKPDDIPPVKCTKDKKEWDDTTVKEFLSACRNILDYNTCKFIERKIRISTGTDDKLNIVNDCCANEDHGVHGNFQNKYHFKKNDDDTVGKFLDEWTSDDKLLSLIPVITEKSVNIFNRVKSRGKKDNLEMMTVEEEKLVRLNILKETLIREIQLNIYQKVREENYRESTEVGLLANPFNFSGRSLDLLLPDTIRDLMFNGVAVQDSFLLDMRERILSEIELIECDNKFNEVNQFSNSLRTDKICWLSQSDLDRDRQRGLFNLFKIVSSLPFELNKKASLCLQVVCMLQLSYHADNGSSYEKHLDGGYDALSDNGRKITCIYYPNPTDWKESDGGILRVYKRQPMNKKSSKDKESSNPQKQLSDEINMEINPSGGKLVLLRSRDVPHEVTPTNRKRFSIVFWFTGPSRPGDDIFIDKK